MFGISRILATKKETSEGLRDDIQVNSKFQTFSHTISHRANKYGGGFGTHTHTHTRLQLWGSSHPEAMMNNGA